MPLSPSTASFIPSICSLAEMNVPLSTPASSFPVGLTIVLLTYTVAASLPTVALTRSLIDLAVSSRLPPVADAADLTKARSSFRDPIGPG